MRIKKTGFLALALFCIASIAIGQNTIRISGFVKDLSSGEVLIGANIIEAGTSHGTISDYNGYFSILIPKPAKIQVSFIGYAPQIISDLPFKDTLLTVRMIPGNELDEVVIKAGRTQKFNVATLKNIELQHIPALGGKPDVLKAIQLLPGIQSQNEGSSLLLVRGGDPGQNLYLIDNCPLIYVNHLGGFTSVFNPDIINNIHIYKGGFPARYGGKISSVVDITQKEGDMSGLKGSFAIGLTDASFTIEGPLKMKNTSFIVTGRKTMVDALLGTASLLSREGGFIVSYGYHDINGKFTWKPDDSNSIHINFYEGDDYLNYWSHTSKYGETGKNHFLNIWGNRLIAGDWKRSVSPKLFISNSISYSYYRLREKQSATIINNNLREKLERRYLNSVQDVFFQSGLKYNASRNWTIDAGLQTSWLIHIPNFSTLSSQTIGLKKEKLNALETNLFFDNTILLPRGFSVNPGIRLSNYFIKDYSKSSLEPRFNVSMDINPNHSLNLSYMRVSQNSHLIFTTGKIMNNEVWIPADKQVPMASSDQVSLGWNGSFKESMFTAELSLYYRRMQKLSTYKEGYTSLMGDENWRSKIETGGKGEAMGAEFLFRKNLGKWTGFAAYTISNATRQYPGINSGKVYLFDYDRLHAFSANASYKLNEKLTFNLSWIFQSGLPYTPPIGRQLIPSLQPNDNGDYFYYDALIYGERNSDRIKDYHRLDLGLSYSKLTKNKRRAEWSFSVNNAYNRKNPNYYYFNTNNTGEIILPELGMPYKAVSLYQMSLFPIIPGFSYKIYFDTKPSGDNPQTKTFKQKFTDWLYHEN